MLLGSFAEADRTRYQIGDPDARNALPEKPGTAAATAVSPTLQPMAFHLFERFGVELEYMIVDRSTLAVRPIADVLLKAAASLPNAVPETDGNPDWPGTVEFDDVAWSNELTAHVIEFKTASPAKSLLGLDSIFSAHIHAANALLKPHNAMLLPAGMHPTMDPHREIKLWPHDYSPVYEAYNRIFDCRGHGWANLQSCHLNLPFAEHDSPVGEFGRLHAAIRILLPIMPALSASSPIMDGLLNGTRDNRLEVYRTNSRRIPEAAGKVIPEPVFTKADYEREIFERIYAAFAPHDPEGILRDEFSNSRGAIARFGRGSIEIRVLDVQECPAADIAIVTLISETLRALVNGRLGSLELARTASVDSLHRVLLDVIQHAEGAPIADPQLLAALDCANLGAPTAGQVWQELADRVQPSMSPRSVEALHEIFTNGSLSMRISRAVGPSPSRDAIDATYRALARCLEENSSFTA